MKEKWAVFLEDSDFKEGDAVQDPQGLGEEAKVINKSLHPHQGKGQGQIPSNGCSQYSLGKCPRTKLTLNVYHRLMPASDPLPLFLPSYDVRELRRRAERCQWSNEASHILLILSG